MSRNTDAAVTSASQSHALRFRLLMNIQSLSGGSFYACTGDRFIYTMGNTYSPVGHLGGIEKIQEDADPFPRAVRAWLSIQNSVAMQAALAESLYRKKVTIHRVFLSSSYTSQGTPQISFKGMIDKARISNDQERGNYIEVEIETRLKQAPAAAYLTKEFFQSRVSTTTDIFLDFIHDIPYYEPAWGGYNPYMPYGPRGDM
jgi:hypothetical protein